MFSSSGKAFRLRNVLVLGGGLIVSLGAAWLAIRGVDLSQVRPILASASWPLLLAGACVVMVANYLRAWRWRWLLGRGNSARQVDLFSITMVGYLANLVLPLRAGDIIRVFMVKWRTGASASGVASSVISERVLDVVTLAVLLAFAVAGVGIPSYLAILFLATGAAGLVVLIALFLMAANEAAVTGFAERAGSKWKPVLFQKFVDVLILFVRGFAPMREKKVAAMSLVLSFAIRAAEVISIMLALEAVGISLPVRGFVLFNSVVTLGLLIPSGPGAIGSYELLGIVVITVFEFTRNAALAGAIMAHAMGMIVTIIFGSVFVWREAVILRAAMNRVGTSNAGPVQ